MKFQLKIIQDGPFEKDFDYNSSEIVLKLKCVSTNKTPFFFYFTFLMFIRIICK